MRNLVLAAAAVAAQLGACIGQHYCWPCAKNDPVIGKDTHASSNPQQCYDFYLKYFNHYLNNGVGNNRSSTGYRTGFAPNWGRDVIEADDLRPNVMAIEQNECGTTIGDVTLNISAGERRWDGDYMYMCPLMSIVLRLGDSECWNTALYIF